MTPQKNTHTIEQIAGIVLGIVLASIMPRGTIASWFSSALGDVGGYCTALALIAMFGAIAGLFAYALLKQWNLHTANPD